MTTSEKVTWPSYEDVNSGGAEQLSSTTTVAASSMPKAVPMPIRLQIPSPARRGGLGGESHVLLSTCLLVRVYCKPSHADRRAATGSLAITSSAMKEESHATVPNARSACCGGGSVGDRKPKSQLIVGPKECSAMSEPARLAKPNNEPTIAAMRVLGSLARSHQSGIRLSSPGRTTDGTNTKAGQSAPPTPGRRGLDQVLHECSLTLEPAITGMIASHNNGAP